MGRDSRRRNDFCSACPIAPFNGEANRHDCVCVSDLEISYVEAGHGLQVLNHLVRFRIAAGLQVGVDEIIHGVKLFSRVALLARRFHRR